MDGLLLDSGYSGTHTHTCIYIYINIYTLWLFNIAMENGLVIADFPS